MEDKKWGKWRESMQSSEWKTCVSFLADQPRRRVLLGIHGLEYLRWIPVVLKRKGTAVMSSQIIKLGAWKETAEFAK
jgi:hypothetical protein